MAKIKDLPKFSRPREKLFEKGPEALKDHELLAILLRTGYQGKSAIEVAQRILRIKPLEQLIRLSSQELAKIKGVGKSRAATIAATFALADRIFKLDQQIVIKTAEDAVKATNILKNKKKEYLVVIYLNARNHLIKTHTVSIGTLTANLVHPREVFAPAFKNHAAQIVLMHNHPSGDSNPSQEDLNITRCIFEAGKLLGIDVVDHIIVTRTGYTSLKEDGLF